MPPAPSLAVDFCGLRLASPIVLLSGCVGFGEEYTRVEGSSNTDVGAIVHTHAPYASALAATAANATANVTSAHEISCMAGALPSARVNFRWYPRRVPSANIHGWKTC